MFASRKRLIEVALIPNAEYATAIAGARPLPDYVGMSRTSAHDLFLPFTPGHFERAPTRDRFGPRGRSSGRPIRPSRPRGSPSSAFPRPYSTRGPGS